MQRIATNRTVLWAVMILGGYLTPSPVWAQSIWLSAQEISALSTRSAAWHEVLAAADAQMVPPNLSDQDETTNVRVLARAFVFARTGAKIYRDEVVQACQAAIGTESDGRTLALGRKLAAYVIAADLVGWRDQRFVDWLRLVRRKQLEGQTLISTHEERPNNWGTHCGASRIAIAAFLDDREDLNRAAKVFHGWLGDRASHAGFKFGNDLSWQADPLRPLGVNPRGALKAGQTIDGALPDDMRRGGSFAWPPRPTDYPWGALDGAMLQAELLARQGYPSWQWEDEALLRAVRFLDGIQWPARGDNQWTLYLVNRRYRTEFKVPMSIMPGKNMAWTNWTHADLAAQAPPRRRLHQGQ